MNDGRLCFYLYDRMKIFHVNMCVTYHINVIVDRRFGTSFVYVSTFVSPRVCIVLVYVY